MRAFVVSLFILSLSACGTDSGGKNGGMTGGTGGRGGPGTGGNAPGSGGGTPGDPGRVIFVGDFETGDLSQWNYNERCKADRILVYSTANAPTGAPAPREGKYAVRFHVLDTDVAPCTSTENPRAELETVESLFRPGDDRWEAWSIYVPANHPQPLCGNCEDGEFFAFQEDYGAPWDGSPSIGWFLDFGSTPARIRMDRGDQYDHDQPVLVTMIKGRWIDFLVHKKFANTASGGGFIEAWIDHNPVTFNTCNNCTRLSTQTMHSSQDSLGFYLTHYRARGLFTTFDTYYDGVRIGTTRASVELP